MTFLRAKKTLETQDKSIDKDSGTSATNKIKENSKLLNDLTKAAVYMAECEEADINYEDLQFSEVLGKGGFGVVFRASWNGTDVAVKTLSTNSNNALSVNALAEFSAEISRWRTLKHPNIIQLLGTSYDTKKTRALFSDGTL
uniref:Protein kinase domain-containing protein n=1 Tax=Aplanochytrium stocchinoi TaxID=215587 RepID=A0A7S3V367_9STRA